MLVGVDGFGCEVRVAVGDSERGVKVEGRVRLAVGSGVRVAPGSAVGVGVTVDPDGIVPPGSAVPADVGVMPAITPLVAKGEDAAVCDPARGRGWIESGVEPTMPNGVPSTARITGPVSGVGVGVQASITAIMVMRMRAYLPVRNVGIHEYLFIFWV